MKKILYTIICAASVLFVPVTAMADDPSGGNEVDVSVGEWDDEEDPEINADFEDAGVAPEVTVKEIRTLIEGGVPVVYSPIEMSMPVFDLNGRLVCILSLSEGRNVVDGLARGVYIIGKTKVNHL